MTTTVPPIETVAPGIATRAPEGAFAGARLVMLALGVLGVVVSAIGWMTDAKQFYFSWLVSFMYVLSLCLGAMFFVVVQHLARAGWSVAVRRVAENFMAAVPLLVVLFIPVVIGSHTLYHHWMDTAHLAPGEAGHDPVLWSKRGYLNTSFFYFRMAAYFVVWLGIATFFRRTSLAQDQNGDAGLTLRMARVAAPCMLLFAFSLTFAAIDWMMTLDPHWFSTIFGVYYFAGCFMSFMALLALTLMWMNKRGMLANAVTTEHYHDVGKLMFAFVVFWTYVAFSQYMLIWYANLPEETLWYQHHLTGSWGTLGRILVIGHFGVPFVFLMSRHMKRRRFTLALGAVLLLVMHWIDLHWIIMPTLHHGVHISWIDISSLIGALGLFVWFAMGKMQGAPLLPERDPRLAESLKFQNH